MPDDPFDGLGLDRTVIMPVPGGRVAPTRVIAGDQAETLDATVVTTGLNVLVAAANPVLNAIPQLRTSVEHPNPGALRDRLAQGIRQFEARARAAGVPTEQVIAARYALCTLIDETAAGTPWGASGAWAQQGLLALFHGEVGGGDKVFQILARLAENPQANLDLIELMYVCMQLGFEGRYRIVEGGQRQLDAIRERLLSIIRKQRGEYERDLSPSWRGMSVVIQPRLGWLPLWVVGAVTALLLLGTYFGFRLSLSTASDTVAREIATLRVPPRIPPRPPPVPAEPRLARFLAEEIERRLVAVADRSDRSVVTILGDGLFAPGDATVRADYQDLLARIAAALTKVPGQIDVIGHTDTLPIRTLRFPSNWELSRARAMSVARLVEGGGVSRDRIRADGLGDTQPLPDASNDTPQGRARNRRVEITLYLPAGGTPAAGSDQPSRKP